MWVEEQGLCGKLALTGSFGMLVGAPAGVVGLRPPALTPDRPSHVSGTCGLNYTNKDFVPILLPFRLPLKIIQVSWPPVLPSSILVCS